MGCKHCKSGELFTNNDYCWYCGRTRAAWYKQLVQKSVKEIADRMTKEDELRLSQGRDAQTLTRKDSPS